MANCMFLGLSVGIWMDLDGADYRLPHFKEPDIMVHHQSGLNLGNFTHSKEKARKIISEQLGQTQEA